MLEKGFELGFESFFPRVNSGQIYYISSTQFARQIDCRSPPFAFPLRPLLVPSIASINL